MGSIEHQFHEAYQRAGEMGKSLSQGITSQVQRTQQFVAHTCQSLKGGCQKTAEKAKEFVKRNQNTILFIGCSCASAYFAPQFFFPAAIITIIFRVELNRQMNQYVEKWKNEWYGPHYISSFDLTLAVIGAVDAVALGTFFVPGSLTVALIPSLGGIAAGNCLAKRGMDIAHYWQTKSRRENHIQVV